MKKKLVTPEVTSRTVQTRVTFRSSERYHSLEAEFRTPYVIGDEAPDHWTLNIKGKENRAVARKLGYAVDVSPPDESKFFPIRKHDDCYKRGSSTARRFATYEDALIFAEELAKKVLTYRARLADLDEELTAELAELAS